MPKIAYRTRNFSARLLKTIDKANDIVEEYVAQGFDLTLRQLYYQFVARDLLPNTARSYSHLGDLINWARLTGRMDWNHITDRTRELRKNSHWDSPGEIIEACAEQYRVDKWAHQPYRVEVWIEKDALIGVIAGVCAELDVPYFSCRGYTSQSEMWRAARRLGNYLEGQQGVVVIHFGDHDPSGIDMARDIRDRLNEFTLGLDAGEIEVRRVALTMEQIEEFGPPPNPAKITDSRAKGYVEIYGYESWELDALEPNYLVKLVHDEVTSVMDPKAWKRSLREERKARKALHDAAAGLV